MLLATSYLPPVSYFNNLVNAESFLIETGEHFVKQTIRNRCHILSPNGMQTLIIPVVHNALVRSAIKDRRLANDHPWQRQHWRSLNAAYRRSAYFEFYMDDFAPFYHKPYEFLIDFNTGLLTLLLDALKLKPQIGFADKYEAVVADGETDLRQLSDTGMPVVSEADKSYPQVFGYKNGFVPGLSIVDLLFNMGPSATTYLQPVKTL